MAAPSYPDSALATGGRASPNVEAVVAKMIALAARNGIEDLHAAGAFSDEQAPSLNRRIRGRIYEALLATRLAGAKGDNDPITSYVAELGQGYGGGRNVAAIQGAVARAVNEFASAEGLPDSTAQKLRKAAITAAAEAHRTSRRLWVGRSNNPKRDRFAVEYWLRSIPDYWEEPEISPEFQELLDRAEA